MPATDGTAARARLDRTRRIAGAPVGVGGFDLQRALEVEPELLIEDDHEHDASVTSVGIEADGELDPERLNRWLGRLLGEKGTDIFRSKGVLAVKGMDDRHVFQGVHMLFDGEPGAPWNGERRANRLVFIGRNLDRAQLTEGFTACLA